MKNHPATDFSFPKSIVGFFIWLLQSIDCCAYSI